MLLIRLLFVCGVLFSLTTATYHYRKYLKSPVVVLRQEIKEEVKEVKKEVDKLPVSVEPSKNITKETEAKNKDGENVQSTHKQDQVRTMIFPEGPASHSLYTVKLLPIGKSEEETKKPDEKDRPQTGGSIASYGLLALPNFHVELGGSGGFSGGAGGGLSGGLLISGSGAHTVGGGGNGIHGHGTAAHGGGVGGTGGLSGAHNAHGSNHVVENIGIHGQSVHNEEGVHGIGGVHGGGIGGSGGLLGGSVIHEGGIIGTGGAHGGGGVGSGGAYSGGIHSTGGGLIGTGGHYGGGVVSSDGLYGGGIHSTGGVHGGGILSSGVIHGGGVVGSGGIHGGGVLSTGGVYGGGILGSGGVHGGSVVGSGGVHGGGILGSGSGGGILSTGGVYGGGILNSGGVYGGGVVGSEGAYGGGIHSSGGVHGGGIHSSVGIHGGGILGSVGTHGGGVAGSGGIHGGGVLGSGNTHGGGIFNTGGVYGSSVVIRPPGYTSPGYGQPIYHDQEHTSTHGQPARPEGIGSVLGNIFGGLRPTEHQKPVHHIPAGDGYYLEEPPHHYDPYHRYEGPDQHSSSWEYPLFTTHSQPNRVVFIAALPSFHTSLGLGSVFQETGHSGIAYSPWVIPQPFPTPAPVHHQGHKQEGVQQPEQSVAAHTENTTTTEVKGGVAQSNITKDSLEVDTVSAGGSLETDNWEAADQQKEQAKRTARALVGVDVLEPVKKPSIVAAETEPNSLVREMCSTCVGSAKTSASSEESGEEHRVQSAEEESSEEVRQDIRETSPASKQEKATPESTNSASFEKDPKKAADANLRRAVNKLLAVESQPV